MNEFDLIEKYFAPLAGPEGLGLKDDTALYVPSPHHDLLITTDSFVEGVHFPNGMYGADVSERLLRTNLSDIAAKGGTPRGYQLSLSMRPHHMEQWIPAFAKGLETTQAEFGCSLWGGDTTATDGPAVFSITLIGEVSKGAMIKRSGAEEGNDIWVSGVLGDAMLGCRLVTSRPISPVPTGSELFAYESAYWRPEPCLKYQNILDRFATASADISDGLLADVKHITDRSAVSAALNFDALPISMRAERWAEAQDDPTAAKQALISFGDDYGVVFFAKPKDRQAIFDSARKAKLKVTLVGSVLSGAGVTCLDVDGSPMVWPQTGYVHK
jgi:thiamine-monophosphate kinase